MCGPAGESGDSTVAGKQIDAAQLYHEPPGGQFLRDVTLLLNQRGHVVFRYNCFFSADKAAS